MTSLIKNNKESYDFMVKILLIGNSGVGKTQILLRYSENNFRTAFISTIGIDFKIKKLQVDDKIIKMQIWDTAGQERYQTITQSYYKGAMGIMCIFALNDRETFKDIEKWMTQIEKHANANIIKILIGNKTDLADRQVTTEEAEQMAKKYKIQYFETSAKEGTNIDQAFYQMAKQIKEISEEFPNIANNTCGKLAITENKEEQKKQEVSSCC